MFVLLVADTYEWSLLPWFLSIFMICKCSNELTGARCVTSVACLSQSQCRRRAVLLRAARLAGREAYPPAAECREARTR